MLVYNIRKEKFTEIPLKASGIANRWNKVNEFVIYTGSSRALSTLELVVHRSSINIESSYKIVVICLDINETDIDELDINLLPKQWQSIKNYSFSQELGSNWYKKAKKLILKVPSAIIQKENNFLINTKHPDYDKKVRILEIEDFIWDKRLL